jgi:hypothetical protein
MYSSYGSRHLTADVFYPAKKSKKGYPAVVMTIEYCLSPEAQYPEMYCG